MRQIETSRTVVFDAPGTPAASSRHRVVDNLDLGQPDRAEIIFTGHRIHRGRPPKTEPSHITRINTRDTIGSP